jgi:hypothetical protein
LEPDKAITTVKAHPDGTRCQSMPDGFERELPNTPPMRDRTGVEIRVAAASI